MKTVIMILWFVTSNGEPVPSQIRDVRFTGPHAMLVCKQALRMAERKSRQRVIKKTTRVVREKPEIRVFITGYCAPNFLVRVAGVE